MKHYVFSDLHGHLDLLNQILDFAQPEDILFCLGDSGDRGPQPWECLKQALLNTDRITYICGNHEAMLLDSIVNSGDDRRLHNWNGGKKTFKGFMKESKKDRNYILSRLINLPTEKYYTNTQGQRIVLTHSGFSPDEAVDYNPIWNREHLSKPWPEGTDIDVMVHGHTIIGGHLNKFYHRDTFGLDKPLWYCDGHKIDIDVGTVITKTCILLDLDTWEYKLFRVRD